MAANDVGNNASQLITAKRV